MAEEEEEEEKKKEKPIGRCVDVEVEVVEGLHGEGFIYKQR